MKLRGTKIDYEGDYVTAIRQNAGYLSDCIIENSIDINILSTICWLCGGNQTSPQCDICRVGKKIEHYITSCYREG